MTTILLTLYEFVERVARLREAQRTCDAVGSEYNRRNMLALELEVDALLIQINCKPVGDEFSAVVLQVGHMRTAQRRRAASPTAVTEGQCLPLESGIDQLVNRYIQEVKNLNAKIQEDNK